MKRGFAKVRNREERIKPLVQQDNIAQAIGHLAQRGIYEFQQNPDLLSQSDGVKKVGKMLELEKQSEAIQNRIFGILKNYYDRPILADKKVIFLDRGDRGYPPAIIIGEGSSRFNLYAGFDCLFIELEIVFNKNNVKVQRELNFWAETVALRNSNDPAKQTGRTIQPAIALTLNSQFLATKNLANFFDSYLKHNTDALIDLQVKTIETGSNATIVSLAGTAGDRREELIAKATSECTQKQLQNAPDVQPIVSIRFGKDSKIFDYPLGALTPLVIAETVDKFGLKYGELLAQTKIDYQERCRLLQSAKQRVDHDLLEYNISLDKALNSKSHEYLFWKPKVNLSDTQLLFGKKISSKKSATLRGLKQGGVYRRHSNFADINKPIHLGILNLSKLDNKAIKDFTTQLQEQLNRYGFKSIIPEENQKTLWCF